MEIVKIINNVEKELNKCGIDERAEAEWLVAQALGVSRNALYMFESVSDKQKIKINDYLAKRKKRIPLDYITGESEFYGLKFAVSSAVLIPRPETELLVEEVLKVAKEKDKILDLGTGSGAISIAIKKSKNVNVLAVDISNDALAIARKNAKNNNVAVEFLQSDFFSNVKTEQYDIIVSNPPYIPTKDILYLQEEVKNYEPILALDGGMSGLECYERIVGELDKFLRVGGFCFFEIGIGQENEIKKLFNSNYQVEVIKDYNNINRIIKARRIK